ncbi:hypothetical protein DFH09DRAFT_529768 [Mycena vulgaris]|nr:hypothetical protein DFH09DRAFT_529768 [Mycena vulgaris]
MANFSPEDHANQDNALLTGYFIPYHQERLENTNVEEQERALELLLGEIVRVDKTKRLQISPATLSSQKAHFLALALQGLQSKTFRSLREEILSSAAKGETPMASTDSQVDTASVNATVLAWEQPFRGDSHKLLYNILCDYMSETGHYARNITMAQSTGTGKSRMTDELGKTILVITFNLADISAQSFPPGDHELKNWLMNAPHIQQAVQLRWSAFIYGAMVATLQELRLFPMTVVSPSEKRLKNLALAFHRMMGRGSSFTKHGPDRISFYRNVVRLGKEFEEQHKTSFILPDTPPTKHPSAMENHLGPDGDGEDGDIQMEDVGSEGLISVHAATQELIRFLDSNGDLRAQQKPLVVLCFDEAHTLTQNIQGQEWTWFTELRRILRQIKDEPIFSLFLSTSGKFHLFSPPPEVDSSNRIRHLDFYLFDPITEIGFDQYAEKLPQQISLHEVASTHQMALLGRMLFASRYKAGDEGTQRGIIDFARTKLLAAHRFEGPLTSSQKLACLAVRLGLEFKAPAWADRDAERKQVERHMRICLAATGGFRKVFTISPSEPLVAEAAFHVMAKNLHFPSALLEHIDSSYLNPGDRGEVTAALIILLARDRSVEKRDAKRLPYPSLPPSSSTSLSVTRQLLRNDGAKRVVSVTEYLIALISKESGSGVVERDEDSEEEEEEDGEHTDILTILPSVDPDGKKSPLSEAFKDSWIYFNHFVKVHDYDALDQEHLRHLVARGAAVICADNQRGIDILIPVVMGGTLEKSKITAILVQVKNSKSFGGRLFGPLFDAMDPVKVVGLFSKQTELPVIRMVFALASKSPNVSFRKSPVRRSPRTVQVSPGSSPPRSTRRPGSRFSAYDIWCAGATHQTFEVIASEETSVYAALLLRSLNLPLVYDLAGSQRGSTAIQKDRAAARRRMNPGTGVHPDHHSNFVVQHQAEPC